MRTFKPNSRDEDTLAVDLSDGRTIIVPLTWYPRLLNGTMGQSRPVARPALQAAAQADETRTEPRR